MASFTSAGGPASSQINSNSIIDGASGSVDGDQAQRRGSTQSSASGSEVYEEIPPNADGPKENDHNTGSTYTASTNEEDSPPTSARSTISSKDLSIDKHVFYNQETLKYMKIIDRYKTLGVGEIELPRLVIAGMQNSGKSSLLENLTGLPVPITTGIATRFPIEINLIQDLEGFRITSSVISGYRDMPLSEKDKDRIHKIYDKPMTEAEFEDLLREASSIFGVPPPLFAKDQTSTLRAIEPGTKQISKHVLRIEMRGPDFKSLSFVDTPGLYASGSSSQDAKSAEEIDLLVQSLVSEGRTVIVGVMEAHQEPVNQKIFRFADDVDVNGERTIGVLTKVDCVPVGEDHSDQFQATLRTAKNQDRVLKHGWYMVKNRSSSEAKASVSLGTAREKEAKLFSEGPWSPALTGLDRTRLGIGSLRAGLSSVFCAHIRSEFPAFNKQTRIKLEEKSWQLKALGPARSTILEQREYLKTIVRAYQTPKAECLSHDYKTYIGFGPMPRALMRRITIHKKERLRDPLEIGGVLYPFKTPTIDVDLASDLAAASVTGFEKTKNIYTWINSRYQSTKSCSLPGIIPYPLIERLFKEQTGTWRQITSDFTNQVYLEFGAAVDHCLLLACSNSQVRTELGKLLTEALNLRFAKFDQFCRGLIKDEQNDLQVIAGEKRFVNDIREARTLRFISALARLENEASYTKVPGPFGSLQSNSTLPAASSSGGGLFGSLSTARSTSPTPPETSSTSRPFSFGPPPTTEKPAQGFKSVLEFAKDNQARLQEVLTHDRQLVYEIHDILKAYYTLSVHHYADAVCKNGLNQKFIEETMDVFSNDFVDGLSDMEVARISAESPDDRKLRKNLQEDILKLETAIKDSEEILKEGLSR
ncbi:P-loop containing nucleoside triphosphate hydrolase protein [Halenospora varia]|nr:P-loop containing nucleoside triphosphate hydrolase protein [Halenospora varia]